MSAEVEKGQFEVLLVAAKAAQASAYAPYSRFRVGAALISATGRLYAGCNVENAAYPVGTCAEAGAIAAMITAGEREIAEILVIGDSGEPTSPCGACRQRIFEFSTPATLVHSLSREGTGKRHTINELLPGAFGPEFKVTQSEKPIEGGRHE